MPFGEQVALDPLEPADHLVHQAADLGEVAADRHHLCAEAVLHRVADRRRQGRLELGGRRRERLDLVARPLERRVERGRLDPSGSGLVDAGLRPLDRVGIHRGRRYSPDRTAALVQTVPTGVRHRLARNRMVERRPLAGRDMTRCQTRISRDEFVTES